MHVEICATEISIENNRVAILSVYRPCSGNVNIFFDALFSALQSCLDHVDYIFLCGDLNIDYLKSNCNSRKLLIDLLDCFNLKITSNDATRMFTNINGSTSITKVDYIIANAELLSYKASVFEAHISDHRAILLNTNLRPVYRDKHKSKMVRRLSAENLCNLSSCLSDHNFVELCSGHDVDHCFENFNNILQYHMEICCPLVKLNSSSQKKWLTAEIISSKKRLNNLYWLHSNFNSCTTYE